MVANVGDIYEDNDVYRAATRVCKVLLDGKTTECDYVATGLVMGDSTSFTQDNLEKLPADCLLRVWLSNAAAHCAKFRGIRERVDYGNHQPLTGGTWISHVQELVSASFSKAAVTGLFRDLVQLNPRFFEQSPDYQRYLDEIESLRLERERKTAEAARNTVLKEAADAAGVRAAAERAADDAAASLATAKRDAAAAELACRAHPSQRSQEANERSLRVWGIPWLFRRISCTSCLPTKAQPCRYCRPRDL